MSEAELQEWERLADAATPGPWEYDAECGYVELGVAGIAEFKPWWERSVHNPKALVARVNNNATEGEDGVGFDGAFIAAARTAVPALVAEVRRLQSIVESAGKIEVSQEPDGMLHLRYAVIADALRRSRAPEELFAYAMRECLDRFREWKDKDARKSLEGGA